jgi:hypothetical protein
LAAQKKKSLPANNDDAGPGEDEEFNSDGEVRYFAGFATECSLMNAIFMGLG